MRSLAVDAQMSDVPKSGPGLPHPRRICLPANDRDSGKGQDQQDEKQEEQGMHEQPQDDPDHEAGEQRNQKYDRH